MYMKGQCAMEIFIPKRIYKRLKSVYSSQITIVSGGDGCGKSTLLREFFSRSRGRGRSCRFIRESKSAEECFGKLCGIVTGKRGGIPASDEEEKALAEQFQNAQIEGLVIIADDPYACDLVLGGFRSGRVILNNLRVPLVVTAELDGIHKELAQMFGYNVISRDELLLTQEETAQFAELYGLECAAERVYEISGGELMSARLALELLRRGEILLENKDALMRQTLLSIPRGTLGALYAAVANEQFSEKFLEELCECAELADYFGKNFAAREKVEALDGAVYGLVKINKRSHRAIMHPRLKQALRALFSELDDVILKKIHLVCASESLRLGDCYNAFCHYFLGGDFDAASDCPRTSGLLSFNRLLRTNEMLEIISVEFPLSDPKILPRYIRVLAQLALTDKRELAQEKFRSLIAFINASQDTKPSVKRRMLFCTELMRTYEDLFVLEKMGAHIKRAYDLFDGERETYAPFHSWLLYAPSVFSLIHRYTVPISTESEQFYRYHKMYCEMIDHGAHIWELYTAECAYFTGDIARAAALCKKELARCKGEEYVSAKVALLLLYGKTALFGGDYKLFHSICGEIATLTHLPASEEIIGMARISLAELFCIQGDGQTDGFFLRCIGEKELSLNRYQYPFKKYLIVLMDFSAGRYQEVLQSRSACLAAADAVRCETIRLKLLMLFAAAEQAMGYWEQALDDMQEALEIFAPTKITAPVAEILSLCPELAEMLGQLPRELKRFAEECAELAAQFRRGVEIIRTYRMSSGEKINKRQDVTAKMVQARSAAFEEHRIMLGLTQREFLCAMLAASRFSNEEITALCDISLDAVKCALKRTFAKLGIRSRGQLRNYLPTIEM